MDSRAPSRILAGLAVLIGIHVSHSSSAAQSAEEYALKAAVLYNVTKFVEWPREAFKGPGDPVQVCILGDNPFGDTLSQAVGGKIHDGRTFAVRQVPDIEKTRDCQVLFISASEQKRFRAILDGIPAYGTLTVGDTETFATEGGILNLKVEGVRIRLQVNVSAAEQHGIRISSRLLGLAEIVRK